MRQGSYPGCCLPPRAVLLTQEASQSGSLDLFRAFWPEDSGPFITQGGQKVNEMHDAQTRLLLDLEKLDL